jgi:hypothetical protein
MPVTHGKGFEDYTYNLYLNETFQGRAAGRIVETHHGGVTEGDTFRITQTSTGAGRPNGRRPNGRLAARETRTLHVSRQGNAHVIDVEIAARRSRLGFSLGPTRHAYFNVRVADSMNRRPRRVVRDHKDRRGGEAVSGARMRAGSISPGRSAADIWPGFAVFPDPRDHADLSWFVADWGSSRSDRFASGRRWCGAANTCARVIAVLVHDGDADAPMWPVAFADFLKTAA